MVKDKIAEEKKKLEELFAVDVSDLDTEKTTFIPFNSLSVLKMDWANCINLIIVDPESRQGMHCLTYDPSGIDDARHLDSVFDGLKRFVKQFPDSKVYLYGGSGMDPDSDEGKREGLKFSKSFNRGIERLKKTIRQRLGKLGIPEENITKRYVLPGLCGEASYYPSTDKLELILEPFNEGITDKPEVLSSLFELGFFQHRPPEIYIRGDNRKPGYMLHDHEIMIVRESSGKYSIRDFNLDRRWKIFHRETARSLDGRTIADLAALERLSRTAAPCYSIKVNRNEFRLTYDRLKRAVKKANETGKKLDISVLQADATYLKRGLENLFKEQDILELNRLLERHFSEVQPMAKISFNHVFEARFQHIATEEELVIKAYRNKIKAAIESAANFFLHQNKKLSNIITKGYYPSPLEYADPADSTKKIYVTVQQRVDYDGREYDAHYYMAAFALLHSHGKRILNENGVVIPNHEFKSADQILEDYDAEDGAFFKRNLQGLFDEIVEKLKNVGSLYLIQKDSKKGNILDGHGYILDLESLRQGSAEVGISLYLAQSGVHPIDWIKYIKTYMDVVQKETGKMYSYDDLMNLTKSTLDAALVTASTELGGLHSRKKSEKELDQMDQLRGFMQNFGSYRIAVQTHSMFPFALGSRLYINS